MPYVAYLRKSRADVAAEAHGEGETLARHETALLALSKKQNLHLTAIYREVVSGETIADRPIMQQLLREVEAGMWDGVLVMEVERLARGDTADQGTVQKAFLYSNTLIITPTKTYDQSNEFDQEYFEFGLFMSRREYKTIRRRMNAGKIASVKEGKFCGSTAPFGYVRYKLPKEKGWSLKPNPEQAEIVRQIFAWYTDSENPIGTEYIAQHLNNAHVPTVTGKPWTLQTIRDILKNKVYTGIVVWGRRKDVKHIENGVVKTSHPRSADYIEVQGRHEALVSAEIYEAAMARMLSYPSKRVPGTKTLQNPLSGFVYCSRCGKKMQRRPFLLSGRRDALICINTKCDTVGADLEVVEHLLLSALKDWLCDYQQTSIHPDAARFQSAMEACHAEHARLEAEQQKIETQRQRAYELIEQGVYTTDVFLERQAALTERELNLTKAMKDVATRLNEYREQQFSASTIIPKMENVLSVYDFSAPAAERNALLSSVLSKVIYHKTTNLRWSDESDLSLTLYPIIPSSYHH